MPVISSPTLIICSDVMYATFIIYRLRVFPGFFMNIEATFQPQFLSRQRLPPPKTDTEDNTRGTPRALAPTPTGPSRVSPTQCIAHLPPPTHSTCLFSCLPVVKAGLNIFFPSPSYRTRPTT